MIDVTIALTILGFVLTLGISLAGGFVAYGRLSQKSEDLMKRVEAVEEELAEKVSNDVFKATVEPMQKTLDQIAKDIRALLKMGGKSDE